MSAPDSNDISEAGFHAYVNSTPRWAAYPCWVEAAQRSMRKSLAIIDAYTDHIASPQECEILREIRVQIIKAHQCYT